MVKRLCAALLICVTLVGCGSSGSSDRHVVSVKTDNGVISYGMTQGDAEKILGNGETRKLPPSIEYDENITTYYRDDSLCFIETENAGDTLFNGVKIGDSMDSVLAKFEYTNMEFEDI